MVVWIGWKYMLLLHARKGKMCGLNSLLSSYYRVNYSSEHRTSRNGAWSQGLVPWLVCLTAGSWLIPQLSSTNSVHLYNGSVGLDWGSFQPFEKHQFLVIGFSRHRIRARIWVSVIPTLALNCSVKRLIWGRGEESWKSRPILIGTLVSQLE